MDNDRKRLASLGQNKASIVFKNANIIDVYTRKIKKGDIAVVDDEIVGVGEYQGETIVDCSDKYISPGFINAHVHIESSHALPINFLEAVIPCGTTTAIEDPHEVANVSGLIAIKYFLEIALNSDFNLYIMAPSCVPATPEEDSGAILDADSLLTLKDNAKLLGLGEMMDIGGVLSGDKKTYAKLNAFKDKKIDGHAPTMIGKSLQAYRLAGITSDHESVSKEEVIEKISAGMFIAIREGSSERNLETIVKCILDENLPIDNFGFCTDDKHLGDIKIEGDISANIKKAIKIGLNPVSAYTIATKNTADHYGLKNLGAIAPSKQADLVILDSLEDVEVNQVWIKGKPIYSKAENSKEKLHKTLLKADVKIPAELKNTVKSKELNASLFMQEQKNKQVDIIKIIPRQIVTEKKTVKINELKEQGINKIAVIERHGGPNNIGIGYVDGIKIHGAAASTVAHDSHNLIVTGDNEQDMAIAANKLIQCGGGYVLVEDREIKSLLEMPVCGLLSDLANDEISAKMEELRTTSKKMGCPEDTDLFAILSFLSLTVIPTIRITNRGYNVFEI